jgi:hypothetical protein
MTRIERDLEDIGRVVPGLFGLLGVATATLPIVDRLFGALPTVLRHQNVASVLASTTSFALIGGHYLSKRRVVRALHARFPTGLALVMTGVSLSVGYVGVTDVLIQNSIGTFPLAEAGLILWHVAIYSALTLGLWQMAWRAYKTKDKPIMYGRLT